MVASSRPFLIRLFLSPSERRLRAGWRLLGQTILMIMMLVGLAILAGLIIPILPMSSGSLMFTLSELISFLAITLSIYLARRWFDRRSFVSLGLKWDHWACQDIWVGIVLAGGMIATIFLLEWVFGWLTIQGFAWDHAAWSTLLINLINAALLFIGVGWTEELLSRGYWLQNLSEGINRTWGVLLSAFFFALAHQSNPHFSWMALIGLFASGLFFAFAYLRTGRLWLPIGLHIGWNFFEGSIFGFQVSGLEIGRLIEQQVEGPLLFTGGDFGPEAGLVLFPVLFLASLAIFHYTRGRIP